MKKDSFLTKNILLVSWVSLFTDIASEMLYPIIPLYFASLGFSPLTLGTIEGGAETISGLIKVFFGHLSDKLKKRKLFVQLGYGLSAFSKPFIGVFQNAYFIFFIRFLDRGGKGIRTAPRDAILIAESKPENRGKAFGFHRAMDSVGATLGPIVSLGFLFFVPGQYRPIFFYALIPGLVSFILAFFISEKTAAVPVESKPQHSLTSFKAFFKQSTPQYKKLVLGFFFLSLLNSSNMFLILRARETGISDGAILVAYILYNFVFALFAYPIGNLLDKYGSRDFYIGGIFIFGLTYVLFGQNFDSIFALIGLFMLYGVFSSIEETVSKTWLSHTLLPEQKATGLGLQLTINTLGFFIGSVAMGTSWKYFGSSASFSIVALLAIPIAFYFYFLKQKNA
jgi:MFS family permease